VVGSPKIKQSIGFTLDHLNDLLSTAPYSHQLSAVSLQQFFNDVAEAS
jgi:hypothetical protein